MNRCSRYLVVLFALPLALPALAQTYERTQSERRHVPPDPPQLVMHDMSSREMNEMMQMDDTARFGMLRVDQLEWLDGEDVTSIEAHGWYGGDYDKIRVEAEGEIERGDYDGRTELLWDRVLDRWFNLQAGVRLDIGERERTWLAVGVAGLAPYWFEVEAAAYVGDAGRTALRLTAEYDWQLTQRLILQPEVDLDVYGKDDRPNRIGAGLSSTELALRLRYEIRREFAPYIGVVWSRRYGDSARFERAAGEDPDTVSLALGLHFWF